MPSLSITILDHATGERRTTRHARSPIRIGRDPSNDLVLAHSFVSRWQAVVRFDEAAATLFALGSANQMRVDGRRLAPGAAITLGGAQAVLLGSLELRLRVRALDDAAALVTFAGGDDAAVSGSVDPEGRPRRARRRGRVGGREEGGAGVSAVAEREDALRRAHAALDRLAEARRRNLDARRAVAAAREAALGGFDPGEAAGAEALDLIHRELDAWEELPGDRGDGLAERRLAGEDPAAALVAEIALRLVPGAPPPTDGASCGRFVDRLVEAIQAFAAVSCELQRVVLDERERLGVASEAGGERLAEDPERLLAALLVPDGRAAGAVGEAVVASASCLQDHVRAVIRGAEGAAHEVIRRLAPRAFPGRRWPGADAARWRAYCATYDGLFAGDRARSTLLGLLRGAYAAALADPIGGEER